MKQEMTDFSIKGQKQPVPLIVILPYLVTVGSLDDAHDWESDCITKVEPGKHFPIEL